MPADQKDRNVRCLVDKINNEFDLAKCAVE